MVVYKWKEGPPTGRPATAPSRSRNVSISVHQWIERFLLGDLFLVHLFEYWMRASILRLQLHAYSSIWDVKDKVGEKNYPPQPETVLLPKPRKLVLNV